MSKIVTSGDRVVGSRLRLRRRQCAISEGRLAHILGVNEGELRAYENGEARIGPERLAKAAEALGTPIAFFFLSPNAADSQATEPGTGQETAPGAAELLSAYSRIASSQLRGSVLRLALHLVRVKQAAVALALAEAHARRHRSSWRVH
jgi:transcriptional regulator with XRE-family HTH domain